MIFHNLRFSSTIPPNYRAPSFPSLYWPVDPLPSRARYLYYPGDIWRFTLLWTLLAYGVCFGAIGLWGWAMVVLGGGGGGGGGRRRCRHGRGGGNSNSSSSNNSNNNNKNNNNKGSERACVCADWCFAAGWLLSVVVVAGVEAVLAGSVVGLILAAVYNAGFFRMSTWVPCVWGVINVLVLIVSSFSLQGAL